MPDVTIEVGKQISFGDHATDFIGGAAGTSLEQTVPSAPTDCQIITTSLADDAARESVKFDLLANRAPRYRLSAAVEMAATPVTGERVDFYIGWSGDSTAANSNPGYLTGADAAYAGGVATLDEGLAQLDFVGSLICSADATGTVQVAGIGTVVPKERYGILVIVNRSGAAFHTDDVETHAVLTPIIDDVAAS